VVTVDVTQGAAEQIDGDQLDEHDETAVLREAPTAPELWQELVLHDVGGSTTDPRDAELAFSRLHADGQPDAVTTALLLLTAWRWRRCTGDLLSRLVDTGLLADEALDELALIALFDDQAHFSVPAAFFSGPVFVLAADKPEMVEEDDDPEPDLAGDDHPPRMHRPMQPPLRRWAAGRLLRRDGNRLEQIRARIGGLEARHAAAAMAGVLDALDALSPEQSDRVVAEALDWPDRTVRRLALRELVERGQATEARQRAGADRDASIRASAAMLAAAPTLF